LGYRSCGFCPLNLNGSGFECLWGKHPTHVS